MLFQNNNKRCFNTIKCIKYLVKNLCYLKSLPKLKLNFKLKERQKLNYILEII